MIQAQVNLQVIMLSPEDPLCAHGRSRLNIVLPAFFLKDSRLCRVVQLLSNIVVSADHVSLCKVYKGHLISSYDVR